MGKGAGLWVTDRWDRVSLRGPCGQDFHLIDSSQLRNRKQMGKGVGLG